MPNLTCLKLRVCHNLQSLGGLEHCSQLEILEVSYCDALEDMSALSECVNLKRLVLDTCCSLCDLAVLKNLPQLQTLRVVHCPHISSLEPVRGAISLRRVVFSGLGGGNEIDIVALDSLHKLESLTLRGLCINHCPTLEKLTFFDATLCRAASDDVRLALLKLQKTVRCSVD